MKSCKKLLMMLVAFILCLAIAACGSTPEKSDDSPVQTESAQEENRDEAKSEPESEVKAGSETEVNDAARTTNIGFIAWSTGMGDENAFIEAVRETLSEQYSDQVGDIVVKGADMNASEVSMILENMIAVWKGQNTVILIVNDEKGFSDEELLGILKDAEKAGLITGVDHSISDAPESTFVYDMSDAAGCARMIMENALR